MTEVQTRQNQTIAPSKGAFDLVCDDNMRMILSHLRWKDAISFGSVDRRCRSIVSGKVLDAMLVCNTEEDLKKVLLRAKDGILFLDSNGFKFKPSLYLGYDVDVREVDRLEKMGFNVSVKKITLPDVVLSLELYLLAVKKDGWSIQHIPKELRTLEIRLLAVQQNVELIQYVPEALRTEEMCLSAVQKNTWLIQYVPEALKTEEMCLSAVKMNGWNIRRVPEALKTEEICLVAVKKDGWHIQYVPEALKTEEICLVAVKKDKWYIRFVPEELRTREIFQEAVNSGW